MWERSCAIQWCCKRMVFRCRSHVSNVFGTDVLSAGIAKPWMKMKMTATSVFIDQKRGISSVTILGNILGLLFIVLSCRYAWIETWSLHHMDQQSWDYCSFTLVFSARTWGCVACLICWQLLRSRILQRESAWKSWICGQRFDHWTEFFFLERGGFWRLPLKWVAENT